jgi:hypothetical protein
MKRLGLLPVLAIAALGAWLWKGAFGLLPAERELSWAVPGEWAPIRAVEMQLYDGETLIKREELSTPNGLMREPVQKVALKGRVKYQARLFVTRGQAQDRYRSTFTVGDTDEATQLKFQP